MKISHHGIFPLFVAMICMGSATIQAQLQITEIMADPTNNTDWEWIEIHNPSATAFDLNGFFVDDGNPAAPTGNAIPDGAAPNIDSNLASTTIIPAGGTAVLYDGSGLDYDDSRFRAAWQVAPSVPLIAVDFWSALNNGGDAIGFWPTKAAYDMDIDDVDADGDFEVVKFDNATLSLNFFDGFAIPDKASTAWNGNGSFQDGANWAGSEAGVGGAVTSIQTFLTGTEQLNNEGDFGNPGVVPAGTTNQLVITEMMTNPASDEPEWEWVEVFNGTGSALDFGSTPHVFDENGGGALAEPNLTEGSIPAGGVAVLFNGGAITAADMEAAWGAGINFIPVDGWQSLNNGGDDLVGIWNGVNSGYTDDKDAVAADPPATSYSNALTWATYDSSLDDGAASFSLISLSADPTDPANWVVSTTGSNANPVFLAGQPTDHDGGEIGSPGVFTPGVVTGLTCDFDADGNCDQDDINALYATGDATAAQIDAWLVAASSASNTANPNGNTLLRGDINFDGNVNSSDLGLLLNNFGSTTSVEWGNGNLNDDGVVNSSDLGQLLNNFGSTASAAAVPEPGSLSLILLAILGMVSLRRHRQ